VARMEEGKLPLNRENFSPGDWVEESVNSFQPMAEAGRKKLKLSAPDSLPLANGDRDLLSRVLGNLLSNALRHSPLGTGEVNVTLSLKHDQLSVEVDDNGPGIPVEFQARIFEKFVQIERQRAHLRTGSGLGLTFCKMVVEAHGGRIFVQSVANEGSTFTFLIPIGSPAETGPQEAPRAAVLSA
jgi:signal transduction histidine kinase